jgi:hypothetical protein
MSTPTPLPLLNFLADVPDPRSAHGRRHSLTAMLAAVCCAVLCGARGFKPIAQWVHDQDIALVHALGFNRNPPKWGAFRKLLVALDPVAFERAVALWAEAASAAMPPERPGGLEPASLDGKSVRGAIGRHEGAVHLLSIMAQQSGLTLRQAEVAGKTNEHKAALELLKGMVLEGRVITGDAMFCQRDLCRQIVDQGGHYFVVVKENQPELLRDVSDAFTRAAGAAFSPSPAGPDRAAVHGDSHRGQTERAGRIPEPPGHGPVERLPRLAARGASLSGRARSPRAGRRVEPGDRLRHHQCASGAGGRGDAPGVVARALGDRESVALRSRRDDG